MDTNTHQPTRLSQLAGRRVREIRQQQRLSQRALADRLRELGYELDHTRLGRIERGSARSLDHLGAIAAALEVTPAQLLSPQDDETAVQLAPRVEPIPAATARLWARGLPLPGTDELKLFAALAPDEQRKLLRASVVAPEFRATLATAPDELKEELDHRLDDLARYMTTGDAIREAEANERNRKEEGDG
jgi:transcriptional regulator with XRE-family HTH domain